VRSGVFAERKEGKGKEEEFKKWGKRVRAIDVTEKTFF